MASNPTSQPPFPLLRLVAGCVAAIAIGVSAELLYATSRDSHGLVMLVAFVPLALLIGMTQRTAAAWLPGALLMPSYWLTALTQWPTTSTAPVGCCVSILFAMPHGIAAQFGMFLSLRRRRALAGNRSSTA